MAKKLSYTPGPWLVSKPFTGPTKCSTYGVRDEKGNLIAALFTKHVAEDAALIAAAPELLAALEDLFEHCAMIHKYGGDADNTKQADAAILVALAAIAKAKGA